MNLSQIQGFVAVAQTGSFTEAAYLIDVTQSAVSHALAALENASGVTLLERSNKGVVALKGTQQEMQEWMGSGMLDVGFVRHSAQEGESTLLFTDELQVCVARGHAWQAQTAITIDESGTEHLIMPRTGCTLPEIFKKQRRQQGPTVADQASEDATILAMVSEGRGITIMPRLILPEKLAGIIGIPLDPPQQIQIGLAVSSGNIRLSWSSPVCANSRRMGTAAGNTPAQYPILSKQKTSHPTGGHRPSTHPEQAQKRQKEEKPCIIHR